MAGAPENYLVWAILSTIFCCLPTGIAAIVFAAQVNAKWESGNFVGAAASSAKARTWTIVSVVVGVAGYVIYVVLALAGFTATESSSLGPIG